MKWLSFKGCSLVFVVFEFMILRCICLSFDLVCNYGMEIVFMVYMVLLIFSFV